MEKLHEPSQVDDSFGLEAEGKILSENIECIDVRPKRKQTPPKQIGKISYKLDLGKNTDRSMDENAFMAPSTSFSTKDL